MPKRINQGSHCIFPPPRAAPKRPVEEYVHTLVVVGWRYHSSVPFCIEGWRGLIWAFATFVMSWLAAKMNTNRTFRRMQPPVNRLYLCLAQCGRMTQHCQTAKGSARSSLLSTLIRWKRHCHSNNLKGAGSPLLWFCCWPSHTASSSSLVNCDQSSKWLLCQQPGRRGF